MTGYKAIIDYTVFPKVFEFPWLRLMQSKVLGLLNIAVASFDHTEGDCAKQSTL